MCLKPIPKELQEKLEEKLIRYELVRQQGKYNMLDKKARELTGLSEAEYMYIISNYEELMNKYPYTKAKVKERLNYIMSANLSKYIAINGCEKCRQQVCEKLDVSIDDLCEECKQKLKQDTSPLFDIGT